MSLSDSLFVNQLPFLHYGFRGNLVEFSYSLNFNFFFEFSYFFLLQSTEDYGCLKHLEIRYTNLTRVPQVSIPWLKYTNPWNEIETKFPHIKTVRKFHLFYIHRYIRMFYYVNNFSYGTGNEPFSVLMSGFLVDYYWILSPVIIVIFEVLRPSELLRKWERVS